MGISPPGAILENSQQFQELLHGDLGLAQNTAQNWPGQVATVVARDGHSQMGLAGMAELGVANCLMMNNKSGA